MTKLFTFDIPFPPSANRIWRNVNGRTLVSKDYRKWKAVAMGVMVSKAIGQHEWLKGRLSVEIFLTPDDNRKWDIDNRVKPVLDALECIIDNDNQIDQLYVNRSRKGDRRRCLVTLSPSRDIQPLFADTPRIQSSK